MAKRDENPYIGTFHFNPDLSDEDLCKLIRYGFLRGIWELSAQGKIPIDLSGYELVPPKLSAEIK